MTSDADRKAACDKIDGTVTPLSCSSMAGIYLGGAAIDKTQCAVKNAVSQATPAQALQGLTPCCGGKPINQICGGAPQVCEAESDFTPDTTLGYECERKSLDSASCAAKGGVFEVEGKSMRAQSGTAAAAPLLTIRLVVVARRGGPHHDQCARRVCVSARVPVRVCVPA